MLVWWLKPLYDRVALAVLADALFGRTPTLLETLVGLPRLIVRTGLLHVAHLAAASRRCARSPRRCSSSKGCAGSSARAACSVLVGRDSRAALGLCFACGIFELVLLAAGLQLAATFRPEGAIAEFWRDAVAGAGPALVAARGAALPLAILRDRAVLRRGRLRAVREPPHLARGLGHRPRVPQARSSAWPRSRCARRWRARCRSAARARAAASAGRARGRAAAALRRAATAPGPAARRRASTRCSPSEEFATRREGRGTGCRRRASRTTDARPGLARRASDSGSHRLGATLLRVVAWLVLALARSSRSRS